MPMPSQKDTIIRSTDWDLLSCRISADTYLQDPLLPIIVDGVKTYAPHSSMLNGTIKRNLNKLFNSSKNPIINRGTYVRTRSIDDIVELFVKSNEQVQLISIGCGSDTRFLNLLAHHDVKVFEYDFENSVKIKKFTLINNEKCREIIQYDGNKVSINNYEDWCHETSELVTPNYHLKSIDLRQLTPETFEEINPEVPTLVLSECVLCYMLPQESQLVIEQLVSHISKGCLVIYEPMAGDSGNFGQVMTQNLSVRGIELPSMWEFNTITKQLQRFEKMNKFDKIHISDLKNVYHNWINTTELNRINNLEFLDELEELDLMNSHYCICLLQWNYHDFFNKNFQINK